MTFCGACGGKVEEGALRCRHCEAPLAGPNAAPALTPAVAVEGHTVRFHTPRGNELEVRGPLARAIAEICERVDAAAESVEDVAVAQDLDDAS